MTDQRRAADGANSEDGARIARIMGRRPKLGSLRQQAALLLVLVVEIILFSVTTDYFWGTDNLINLLGTAAPVGIIALPATLLLIAGQVDLSVGSAVALIGMMTALGQTATDSTITTFGMGLGLTEAVLVGIAFMFAVGIVNALLVTGLKLNSIITTLATLAIFRGVTTVLGKSQSVEMRGFSALGRLRPIWNVPLSVFIWVGIIILFVVVMRYTVYGRALYAIGASPEAARLSGIRVGRYIAYGFVLSGIMVGLGALILLSQVGFQSSNTALGWELRILTAVILGGASLTGGSGTILGTLSGLLVLEVMRNGLRHWGWDSAYIEVAQGVLLILAVTVDRLRIRLTTADV